MKTSWRTVATVPVVLAALTACRGGEPSTAPSQATPSTVSAPEPAEGDGADPCTLLPVEEVARVTGLDLSEGELDTSIPSISTCVYESQDRTAVVQAVVQAGPGTREAYQSLGDGTEPVEGIGDEARWDPGLRTVDALVGERSLSVSVAAGDDPDAPELREQSEELARLLADAL